MEFLQQHYSAARFRVALVKGQIERHEELLGWHVQMSDREGAQELTARIDALERDLIHAEAVRTAVACCYTRSSTAIL